ncbi:MAG: molecular chaperone DnaJ [Bryobacterales bacterium]|nr:molecular chaperone DnaJ [Bryobacterales bacterium]
MPAGRDYYETLGVKHGASADEIRRSYRRLARKHHPDLNPGDKAAEEQFKRVQEAYDVLSDSKKKQFYDQHGFWSESGFAGAGQQSGGPNFSGFDFDAFTRGGGAGGAAGAGFGGAFSDIFSQFFKGRGAQPGPDVEPERGNDLEYALDIDFWQSMKGAQIRLSIERMDSCATCHGSGAGGGGGSTTCPQCQGSGQVNQMMGAMRFSLPCPKCNGTGRLRNACPTCGGDGRVPKSDSVEVRIPAGVQNGSRLRVAGKGNAGTLGASAGDLYITIRTQAHPFFNREGDDILIRVPVTVTEAGLGARIEIPTVDGKALLKIPQGTQNGQKFRLREKGVYNARKGYHGDQIVEIVIEAPDVRDERTRELLKQLAQVDTHDPRAQMWAKV